MGRRPPGRLLRYCRYFDAAATACSSAAAGKLLSRYWRHFVFAASPLIGGGQPVFGGLVTMASAVRVLYPALAMSWQMSAAQIGLLYGNSAGAAIGALTSGQLAHSSSGAHYAGFDSRFFSGGGAVRHHAVV